MNPGTRKPLGDAFDALLDGVSPKDATQEASIVKPESRDVRPEAGNTSPESGIKLQDSGVTTQESDIKPPEARDQVEDSGIMRQEAIVGVPESSIKPQDSGIELQESGVMTPASSALTQDSAVQPHETRPRSRGERRKSRGRTPESSVVTDDIVDQAVAFALQSPKISLYSPLLLAVLESQQLSLLNRKEMTLLHYRKATKARELVEKALMDSYPDLCEKILKRLNEGNGKS